MPDFVLHDQYGKAINSVGMENKLVVMLGCHYRDIQLCRIHGRKIYWQLQNKPGINRLKIQFVPYINLISSFDAIENYISSAIKEKYESIYLDRKGYLQEGLKSGFSYLRIYKNSTLEYSNYYEIISNEGVDKIFTMLNK